VFWCKELPVGVETLSHSLCGKLHVDLDEQGAIKGAVGWFVGHKVIVELFVGSKVLGSDGCKGCKAWIGQGISLGDVKGTPVNLKGEDTKID